MKKIRITESQAKALGININENDTESGLKTVGTSIGEVVVRIVVSGDKVESLKDRIIQLIMRQDPEAKIGFFEITKRIVGNVKEIKVNSIKRDLTSLDNTIIVEKKPISKSIKEGKNKVKITKEQYNRLFESINEDDVVKGGLNRVDNTFKKAFSGKIKENEDESLSRETGTSTEIDNGLKTETLELIKHLYRKSEDLSPFWEKNGLTHGEICKVLLDNKLIISKNGKYELAKNGGSPQSAVQAVEDELKKLIKPQGDSTKELVSEPKMETETAERELNPPEDKNISYSEPKQSKEIKLECVMLIEYDNIGILISPDKTLWVFNYEGIENKDFAEYASLTRTFVGRDEDGKAEHDYGSNFDMTPEVITHYVNDNLNGLSKGVGVDDFGDGIVLVKIDEPLRRELLSLYDKDKNIVNALSPTEVVKPIDEVEFPNAWENLKKSLDPVKKAPIDKDVIKSKLDSLKNQELNRREKESSTGVEEMTSASSSGSFTGPLSGGIIKKEISDVPVVGEITTVASAGNFQYDTPGLANIGRDGEFKNGSKTKAQSKTQYAGGSFVETSSCTKLNNNKEAQNGKCSQGAVDGVVKQKKTNGSIISPSLGENKVYEAIAKKTGKTISEVKEIISRKNK